LPCYVLEDGTRVLSSRGMQDALKMVDESSPTQGNFRLNKMMHICYMLHYAKYGQPLFFESLRAYQRGAIVYQVYKNYFEFYNQKLTPEEISLETEKKDFINKIYHHFKKYQDQELEIFSHDDLA
jgi:uncharacterized phage-associated protein